MSDQTLYAWDNDNGYVEVEIDYEAAYAAMWRTIEDRGVPDSYVVRAIVNAALGVSDE